MKAGRTTAETKLDTRLRTAIERLKVPETGADTRRRSGAVDVDESGRALVDIDAPVSAELRGAIEAAGGQVVGEFPAYHSTRARVPLAQLENLAARLDVKFIRTAEQAITASPSGVVR